MQYTEFWGAIADHSGDSYFEFCYLPDWPRTLNELARYRRPMRRAGRQVVRAKGRSDGRDDGRVRRFLDAMWAKDKLNDSEAHTLMEIAMAATYDADPRTPLGFRVPVDLDTGELIPKRWQRWRAHDPINLVRTYARNLRRLRGIYVDCGWRDQYHLHFGARILSRELAAHGIAHTYEEFDDTHSSIDYRMDVSLPFLYRALK